jgi:hypothetical protein
MSFPKRIFILVLFGLILTSGCSGKDSPSYVPSDFALMMDVRSADDNPQGNIHVNIRIDARGKGRIEYYDSGNSINYDPNNIITYQASQVVKSAKFNLTTEKLERLWDILNDHGFFELNENYQRALGHSFAFIMVEANGEKHMVDNIGMEVPEIKSIVEAIETLLPPDINFEYGEGFTP